MPQSYSSFCNVYHFKEACHERNIHWIEEHEEGKRATLAFVMWQFPRCSFENNPGDCRTQLQHGPGHGAVSRCSVFVLDFAGSGVCCTKDLFLFLGSVLRHS